MWTLVFWFHSIRRLQREGETERESSCWQIKGEWDVYPLLKSAIPLAREKDSGFPFKGGRLLRWISLSVYVYEWGLVTALIPSCGKNSVVIFFHTLSTHTPKAHKSLCQKNFVVSYKPYIDVLNIECFNYII